MTDAGKYFSKWMTLSQSTQETKECAAILYNDSDIQMGDRRLNHLAALTWNSQSCDNIFRLLENAISPTEAPWKTIYKALLVVHTILLYGSELAVDRCINMCKFIHPLRQYNSALARKSMFSSGGTDYGAPVRTTAITLSDILMQDANIRKVRAEMKQENTLVPLGETVVENHNPSKGIQQMTYGQGITTSVGAGFSLEAVPGMYEGRPERYFDNTNDPRSRTTQGNSQITRDRLAPDLLDLAFDTPATTSNLPSAEYLPALQKQQELEKQLKEQQELLRKLQEQQQLQEQQRMQAQHQQQLQQQQQFTGSLLDLQMPAPSFNQSYTLNNMGMAPYPPQQQLYQQHSQMSYPGGYANSNTMYSGNGFSNNPQHQQQQQSQMGMYNLALPMQQQMQQPVPAQQQQMFAPVQPANSTMTSTMHSSSMPSGPQGGFYPISSHMQGLPNGTGTAFTPAGIPVAPGHNKQSPSSSSMLSMIFEAAPPAPPTTLSHPAPPLPIPSTQPSMMTPALSRPAPVDINNDQDYIAYFSAQYQSHNINFEDTAPPPGVQLAPKSRVAVLSRGNSIHENQAGSPLHWSFDHHTHLGTPPHGNMIHSNIRHPNSSTSAHNRSTPTLLDAHSSNTSSPSNASYQRYGNSAVNPPQMSSLQQHQPPQQLYHQGQQSYAQDYPNPHHQQQQQQQQQHDYFADIPMVPPPPPPPVPSFQPPANL